MATSRRKQQYTPQQRQDYVEPFAGSGLKQAEFCRRAKLHPMTFSLWRRKLKPTAAVFAEVEVSSPGPVPAVEAPAQRGAVVLHLRDGATLEVALAGKSAWAQLKGAQLKGTDI